jgi:ABC transport system ATP-binding/permease protein
VWPNLFKSCRFLGIATKYVPAINQPEPIRPELSEKPKLAHNEALQTWQKTFETWQKNRQKAISEAEGVISKTYDELGYLFNINVLTHFDTEGGLILGQLVLLPFVQKHKDSI